MDRSPMAQHDADENQHFFESKRLVDLNHPKPFCDESDSEEEVGIGFNAAKFVLKDQKPQQSVNKQSVMQLPNGTFSLGVSSVQE
jgi:hypothetical protein